MTITFKYPTSPITPHGAYIFTRGLQPEMTLKSWDGGGQFNLMGGFAIPDRLTPESVQLVDIDGLIPPWRHIDQKGATQDGVTSIDALLDPIEVKAKVVCRGRDGAHTRKVVRTLLDSIDAIKESQLKWYTQEQGDWWAPIRWFQGAPTMPLIGGQQHRQPISLRLRADTALWQSTPVITTVTGGHGWVPIVNTGDQPMYVDFVCYGPGTFSMKGADMLNVDFGPLAANQIALVRTDPRKRGVYDLTTTPPPQQSLNQFQTLLAQFMRLASNQNLPPLLQAIESAFGIAPPQGPLYALLNGRFADSAAVPPKTPGVPATACNVRVNIVNGGAGSKVIVCGTPLRRWPL